MGRTQGSDCEGCMKRETLQKLIDGYSGNDLAGYLYGVMESQEKIKRQMAMLENKTRKAQAEYESELVKIVEEMREVRKLCPHHETEYNPDPSGNNDSYTCCLTCGAEL